MCDFKVAVYNFAGNKLRKQTDKARIEIASCEANSIVNVFNDDNECILNVEGNSDISGKAKQIVTALAPILKSRAIKSELNTLNLEENYYYSTEGKFLHSGRKKNSVFSKLHKAVLVKRHHDFFPEKDIGIRIESLVRTDKTKFTSNLLVRSKIINTRYITSLVKSISHLSVVWSK